MSWHTIFYSYYHFYHQLVLLSVSCHALHAGYTETQSSVVSLAHTVTTQPQSESQQVTISHRHVLVCIP